MNIEIYTNLIANPDILKDHQTSKLKTSLKNIRIFSLQELFI